MKKHNFDSDELFTGTLNQVTDKLCGVCNYSPNNKAELSDWITCESCQQGYHGNHILEKGKDGYCPLCHGPLLNGIDMELYQITGVVSGQMQFQLRKRSIYKGSSKGLFLLIPLFLIASFFLVVLLLGAAVSS